MKFCRQNSFIRSLQISISLIILCTVSATGFSGCAAFTQYWPSAFIRHLRLSPYSECACVIALPVLRRAVIWLPELSLCLPGQSHHAFGTQRPGCEADAGAGLICSCCCARGHLLQPYTPLLPSTTTTTTTSTAAGLKQSDGAGLNVSPVALGVSMEKAGGSDGGFDRAVATGSPALRADWD